MPVQFALARTNTAVLTVGGSMALDAHAGRAPIIEFISFAVGEDQYGVDIIAVCKIKNWSKTPQVQKQQDYVHGVLDLRGVIVAIIQLLCRFSRRLTKAMVLFDSRRIELSYPRTSDIPVDGTAMIMGNGHVAFILDGEKLSDMMAENVPSVGATAPVLVSAAASEAVN